MSTLTDTIQTDNSLPPWAIALIVIGCVLVVIIVVIIVVRVERKNRYAKAKKRLREQHLAVGGPPTAF